jgi:hypothetical protein
MGKDKTVELLKQVVELYKKLRWEESNQGIHFMPANLNFVVFFHLSLQSAARIVAMD